MRRSTLRQSVALAAVIGMALTGCGEADDTADQGSSDGDTAPDERPDPEEPVDDQGDDQGDEQGDDHDDHDDHADEPDGEFDADQARAEAEALLGTAEDDVEEGQDLRIIRRGDEEFLVTADHQPGRQNVELEEDDAGTFVVVRVVVEVPDGEDPIDVS